MRLLVVDEEMIAGGVDTLRRRLLPALASKAETLVWVLPGHAAGDFTEVKAAENVRIETLGSPGGLARLREAMARRRHGRAVRAAINRRLRTLARQYRCDVCLTTCVFGQEVPDVGLPVAGFVSDINPALPERVAKNIGQWIEKTAATFAVSDFTCSELKRFRPDCAGKIYSIPLAGPGRIETEGPATHGHFYYPGVPNAHKGHLALLEAARGLAEKGYDFRLILSGAGLDAWTQPDHGNDVIRQMRAYVAEHRLGLEGRVIVAGDAKYGEIARLFSQCSCVVLPSTYEGFGLPLVEALSHGKQVICSDIPPFREQVERYACSDLVTFTTPGDKQALEAAMLQHLAEAPKALVKPEILAARLHRWTWQDAAQRCVNLLEGVAHRG